MKLDTIYLTHKLRPILQDFCNDYDYILPPIEYMSSLTIKTKPFIESNNTANSAYGRYTAKFKLIEIKESIPNNHMTITLVHELIHAIQHYNLGDMFSKVYTHQYNTFGYQDCPLEVQARSSECLLKYCDEDLSEHTCQAILAMIKEGYKQLKRKRKEMFINSYYYYKDEPWYTRNNWAAISAGHTRRR